MDKGELSLDANDRKKAFHKIISSYSDGDAAKGAYFISLFSSLLQQAKQLHEAVSSTNIADTSNHAEHQAFTDVRESFREATQRLDRHIRNFGPLDFDALDVISFVNTKDRDFLNAAKAQLQERQNIRAGETGSLAASLDMTIRNKLHNLREPIHKRDAWFFSSEAARKVLDSDKSISIPIFVHCPNMCEWTVEPDTPPIQQLLNQFANKSVELQYACPQCPKDFNRRHTITVRDLEERIQQQRSEPAVYPLQISTSASLFAQSILPDFLHGANSRFLTHLERETLAHVASPAEFQLLSNHFQNRQTTFSIAEQGASTTILSDGFGCTYWLSCQQGEVGFAWCNRPLDYDLDELRQNPKAYWNRGDWFYRVLRKGDVAYFGPGTCYFLFQLSKSGPTLTVRGHVLRKSDVLRCLKVSMVHIELAMAKDSRQYTVASIIPVLSFLLPAMRRLLEASVRDAAKPDENGMTTRYQSDKDKEIHGAIDSVAIAMRKWRQEEQKKGVVKHQHDVGD